MQKLHIRLELEGEIVDKFLYVKERRGLRNNTEVVRQLIVEAAERMGIRKPKGGVNA